MKIGSLAILLACVMMHPALAQAPAGRGAAPPAFQGPQPAPAPGLLHAMFQDHAVLQRGQPIKVYGDAPAGTNVNVTLGSASASATADAGGHWKATLPAMPAGGPYTLTASGGGKIETANDVLVGDVFFCTGQSNMAFGQSGAANAAQDAREATDSQVRQLNIPTNGSITPLATFANRVNWTVESPQTVGRFSASCWYFVRELKKTVNVPMGMVVAAWGGARIRDWVSEPALRRLSYFNDDLDMLDTYKTDQQSAMHAWGRKWEAWWHGLKIAGIPPWDVSFDDTTWPVSPNPGQAWALWHGDNPDGFIGQMWLRTSVTLTTAQAALASSAPVGNDILDRLGHEIACGPDHYENLTPAERGRCGTPAILDLGSVNEEDETWINGKDVGGTSFSNKAEHVVPPGVLKEGRNVIVSNIFCSWRNCGFRGPDENRVLRLAGGTNVVLNQPWRYKQMSDKDDIIAPMIPWGVTHGLTMDYNGMVAPVGAYGFKAAVWYQGESNIYFPEHYRTTLDAMMTDWRGQFGDRTLPFLIVQIPDYGAFSATPNASTGWSQVREAQRLAVKDDAHAALIVTVDIGDPASLHPTNKQEVGRRLAIAARHAVYGEAIAPSGPEVAGAGRSGGGITVRFTGVSGRLVGRSGVNGFELCGDTQASCRWAHADIKGDSVVLANAGKATRVRYCWGDSPVCTLYDTSGLPAGPFEAPVAGRSAAAK